jgi:CBS domain-containing protein
MTIVLIAVALKAFFPILIIVLGSTTFSKFSHNQKTSEPISVTPSGITTEVISLLAKNASSAISVTPEGIVTKLALP